VKRKVKRKREEKKKKSEIRWWVPFGPTFWIVQVIVPTTSANKVSWRDQILHLKK
jgi:hypothetical protein